jgi:DNA-3-methyladenine glycosylase
VKIARALLGKWLIHETDEGPCGGPIVETEAYLCDDPACHAVLKRAGGGWEARRTARNAPMFGPPGTAYVYRVYTDHLCFNIVTQPEGVPEAVLIRAIEPTIGVELMRRRRGVEALKALTSGPAKLTQALAIGRSLNGADLRRGPLRVLDAEPVPKGRVVVATRIGVRLAADKKWRFYIADSPYLSRRWGPGCHPERTRGVPEIRHSSASRRNGKRGRPCEVIHDPLRSDL